MNANGSRVAQRVVNSFLKDVCSLMCVVKLLSNVIMLLVGVIRLCVY